MSVSVIQQTILFRDADPNSQPNQDDILANDNVKAWFTNAQDNSAVILADAQAVYDSGAGTYSFLNFVRIDVFVSVLYQSTLLASLSDVRADFPDLTVLTWSEVALYGD